MRRFGIALLSALIMVFLTTMLVFASSVHLKGPLTFTDNGLTLTASGALAGLGNTNLQVDYAVSKINTDYESGFCAA